MKLQSGYIGKEVYVSGINGRIIDETKNLIIIKSDQKIKKFIKKNNTFMIKLNGRIHKIDGKDIIHRAEDRIRQR